MSEHTEVPWKAEIRQNNICILSGDKAIALMCVMPDNDHLYKPIVVEANAELIVRACSSHKDFMETNEWLYKAMDRNSAIWFAIREQPGADEWAKQLGAVIAEANKEN